MVFFDDGDDDDDGDDGDDDDDSGFETHWVPPLQTSKPLANGTFDCSAFREQHISPRTVDMAEDFHKRMNAQWTRAGNFDQQASAFGRQEGNSRLSECQWGY